MGFGVASTAPKSPGLMSPRRSEGVRWVPLTEQALAAADFQESRRALWPLDANAQQAFAIKEGRTPAFASRPDNVLSPQTAVKKSPSMESLMPQQLPQSLKRLPQSGSVAQLNMMQAQRALSACLPKAAEKRSTMGPGDAIVCERMLPELAADNVMWYLLQLSHGSDRWVIMRRYREWHALRQSLCSYGIGGHIPFPDKRLLWALCTPGGKHDPSVISQRTAALHTWATALLTLEAATEHELVIDFFELQPPAPAA